MCWGAGCIWLFTNRAFVQSMNSMGTIGRHASANMGVSDSSLSRMATGTGLLILQSNAVL